MANWNLLICLSICRDRSELYRQQEREAKERHDRVLMGLKADMAELRHAHFAGLIVDSDGNLPIYRL